ncbi:hypothetical protein [Lichenibacterium ramalinae]|uniref:Uncharacterized protein n=1 Tax=Lichenibacterium ramalinae TaxID=2316527 RepID=A0A4Q2R7P1_9HYPH|nr:hypothetical protein [Lichenibacterium ramalinae]RYB02712.1 hypothetical protein D3272_20180 [Lichenibacterium ramalinae]
MVATHHSAQRGIVGFSAKVDGIAARRQLRMSVGVVAMLAVGIVSAAVTVGPHPMSAKRDVLSMKPVSALHADSDVVGARPI